MNLRVVILAAALVPAVQAQFQLFAMPDNSEKPVATVYDLGKVPPAVAVQTRFRLRNVSSSSQKLTILSVAGVGFSLAIPASLPVAVAPQGTFDFAVQFQAADTGSYSAGLSADGLSVLLTIAVAPGVPAPMPMPRVTIDLPKPQNGQQGSVSVAFDATARAAGTGTLTLDFQPLSQGASDVAVAFASGGRTAPFTFSAGDTQARFGNQTGALLQTGTTAGALTVKAQIGDATDQNSVAIGAAPISLSSASATRPSGNIEIDLAGFDNTRTAGPLVFTFFDAGGNTISPGAIRADATSDFGKFFQSSDVGGSFALRALFPVTGDPTGIFAFQVEMTNTAGTTSTGKTQF